MWSCPVVVVVVLVVIVVVTSNLITDDKTALHVRRSKWVTHTYGLANFISINKRIRGAF